MNLTLLAVALNDSPLSQPITAQFDNAGGTIGRADHNTMALPDPERYISRLQAELVARGAGYVIRNVGGANPIIVAGRALMRGETAPLADGDEIRIGGYLLRVQYRAGRAEADSVRGRAPREAAGPPEAALAPLASDADDPWLHAARPARAAGGQATRQDRLEPVAATPAAGNGLSSSNPFADLLGSPAPAPAPPAAAAAATDPFADLLPPPAGVAPDSAALTPAAAAPAARLPDDFDPFATPVPRAPVPAAPTRGGAGGDFGDLVPGLPGSRSDSAFEGVVPASQGAGIDELFGLGRDTGGRDPLDGFLSDLPRPASPADAARARAGPAASAGETFAGGPVGEAAASGALDGGATDRGVGPPPDAMQAAGVSTAPHARPAQAGALPLDPLALFGGAAPAPADPGPTQADDLAAIHAAFSPPRREASAGARASPGPSVEPAAGAAPAAPAAPAEAPQTRPRMTRADELDRVSGSAPEAPRPPAAAQVQPSSPAGANPPAAQSAQTVPAAWQALCRGAGIELSAPTSAEGFERVGQILRAAVEGTLQLVAVRASTKHELRAGVTVIQPRNNNPLKFAPDARAALEQLLQPAARGFLDGPAAMDDAMRDLVGHSIGTVAGMRAAIAGVLDRFAPEVLQAKLVAPTVFDSLLPMNRKARLWELYLQHYGSIREDAEDDFHTVFGKAFLAAYEQQVERLARESGRR